jgi:hypothetical protein
MGKAYYGDQPAQDYDYAASKTAGQQKIADMFRRSQPMGPAPPTGVASYGVGPVGGGGSVGDAVAGVPSESGEYDRQQSQVDVARAAADQQQEAADEPAPPPPQPQSSIQAMEGGGMDRSRLMQEMQGRRQMMQRRPYGRGRGPATY